MSDEYDARAEGRVLAAMRDHINSAKYDTDWSNRWDELMREANCHAARRHRFNRDLAS